MIYPHPTHPNKIFDQSSRNTKISWGIHKPFLRTTNSNIIIITNRSVVNKILRYRWQSDICILAITVSMEMMDMIMRRVLDCHKVVLSGKWRVRNLSISLFSLLDFYFYLGPIVYSNYTTYHVFLGRCLF
jgi:hypothetical protein